MFPFEEIVELGSTNSGQAIGGTENAAGCGVTDDGDTGLVTCRQFKAMTGEAGAEVVAIGAGGPSQANVLAGQSQIDAVAFPGLVSLNAIGRNGLRPVPQSACQTAREFVVALTSQSGENGHVMSASDDGMAEFEFEQSGNFLMPCTVETG